MASDLREYQKLWMTIAESNEPVSVVVHMNHVRTLIQAVRKEKCLANNTRKGLDMPRYGRLSSTIGTVDGKKDHRRIRFSLTYNGDKL